MIVHIGAYFVYTDCDVLAKRPWETPSLCLAKGTIVLTWIFQKLFESWSIFGIFCLVMTSLKHAVYKQCICVCVNSDCSACIVLFGINFIPIYLFICCYEIKLFLYLLMSFNKNDVFWRMELWIFVIVINFCFFLTI